MGLLWVVVGYRVGVGCGATVSVGLVGHPERLTNMRMSRFLKKQDLVRPGVKPQHALASICKPQSRVPLNPGGLKSGLANTKKLVRNFIFTASWQRGHLGISTIPSN